MKTTIPFEFQCSDILSLFHLLTVDDIDALKLKKLQEWFLVVEKIVLIVAFPPIPHGNYNYHITWVIMYLV